MKHKLELAILPQPDFTTCGPTCLHAIYRYFGDDISLEQVVSETHSLDAGGTYSVFLACHALKRGYRAKIFTYNLRVFDPTWFALSPSAMQDRLRRRLEAIEKPRLELVIRGFMEFLTLGGEIDFEDLTTALVRKYLKRKVPILTGLSSTYLYRTMRERGTEMVDDDVRGDPQGHFVVLCGYDKEDRSVLVADPLSPNPAFQGLQYVVNIDRVICSILLGALTNDADLLIIEPPEREQDDGSDHAQSSDTHTHADNRYAKHRPTEGEGNSLWPS